MKIKQNIKKLKKCLALRMACLALCIVPLSGCYLLKQGCYIMKYSTEAKPIDSLLQRADTPKTTITQPMSMSIKSTLSMSFTEQVSSISFPIGGASLFLAASRTRVFLNRKTRTKRLLTSRQKAMTRAFLALPHLACSVFLQIPSIRI